VAVIAADESSAQFKTKNKLAVQTTQMYEITKH